MEIRPLRDKDIEAAMALESACYTEADELPNATDRWNHWFKTIDQEIVWGMFIRNKDKDDDLIGLIYAADKNPSPKRAPNNDPAYRIEALITHPAHRNKKIGSKLLSQMICSLVSIQPKRPITLHVEKGSDAVRLYERFGFHAVGDQGYSFDGKTYASMALEPFKDDTLDHVPTQG